MNKVIILFLISFFIININDNSFAQSGNSFSSKKIAITFDDLPLVRSNFYSSSKLKDIFSKLIEKIVSEKVLSIGFVNEEKLYINGREDNRRVSLLVNWLDAGLEIGNHTFAHLGINELPMDKFKESILKGEKIFKRLLAERGQTPNFFRPPYLHTGLTLNDKKELENFLSENGYKMAPVTIVSDEAIYSTAYIKALEIKDNKLMKKVAEDFVNHINSTLDICEKQSDYLFGRQINQILLLHSNEMNADYFDALCRVIRDRGYQFISLEEAIKDEAYKTPEKIVGRIGVSWLNRWAQTRLVTKPIFGNEPKAAKEIIELAGITN